MSFIGSDIELGIGNESSAGLASSSIDDIKKMAMEMKNLNLSPSFWKIFDGEFSANSCQCSHHLNYDFVLSGNFKLAQDGIFKSLKELFDKRSQQVKLSDILLLLAINKVQDQFSGGKGFLSKRTQDFCKIFKIEITRDGVLFCGASEAKLCRIVDFRKFIKDRFELDNSKEKITAIRQAKSSCVESSRQIVDLLFKDYVEDPALRSFKQISNNLPSLSILCLIIGLAQLVMRASQNQDLADETRDSVGAMTEMAAFFVFANVALENLIHSFVLAAPAFIGVFAYHNIITRFYAKDTKIGVDEENINQVQIPNSRINIGEVLLDDSQINILDQWRQNKKLILEKLVKYVNDEKLWEGLNKTQQSYQDNQIESKIKKDLQELIKDLESFVFSKSSHCLGDFIKLLEYYEQSLSDMFHILKSFSETFNESLKPSIDKDLEDFLNLFAHDGLLLNTPSEDAIKCAFALKLNMGLVSIDERITQQLPHMPTGSNILIGGAFIAAVFTIQQIYEISTGQEEIYTRYFTEFPDHLFDWLRLSEVYENVGGDAVIAQHFQEFFTSFNVAENSTHIFIALLPIFAYQEYGAGIFDNLHHGPINNLAYLYSIMVDSFQELFSSNRSNDLKEYDVDVESGLKIDKDRVLKEDVSLEVALVTDKEKAEYIKKSAENITIDQSLEEEVILKTLEKKPPLPPIGFAGNDSFCFLSGKEAMPPRINMLKPIKKNRRKKVGVVEKTDNSDKTPEASLVNKSSEVVINPEGLDRS